MKAFFNSLAVEYDNWFVKNDKLYESELNAIKSVFEFNKNTIEIGCGTGVFAKPLAIKIGLEPCAQMADIAKERGIEVVDGVVQSIPFKDSTFDCAVLITVDCFLEKLNLAFDEINRVLNNDGELIMAFIDLDTKLGALYESKKQKNKFYKSANFHKSSEVISALKKSGFMIIEKRQTVFSLTNEIQETKDGHGEGVFAVVKAKKIRRILC